MRTGNLFMDIMMKKKKTKPVYYDRYLRRDSISKKEYYKFRKILNRLEKKFNLLKSKISIVEKILNKYLKSPSYFN